MVFGWTEFRTVRSRGRTVRGCLADSLRAPRGRSVVRGLLQLVLCDLTDGPWRWPDGPQGWRGRSAVAGGQSARLVRTVRPSWPDGPPEPVSFASWFDSSPSFMLPRVLQGIVRVLQG
jgi:hypothetical protein